MSAMAMPDRAGKNAIELRVTPPTTSTDDGARRCAAAPVAARRKRPLFDAAVRWSFLNQSDVRPVLLVVRMYSWLSRNRWASFSGIT